MNVFVGLSGHYRTSFSLLGCPASTLGSTISYIESLDPSPSMLKSRYGHRASTDKHGHAHFEILAFNYPSW